MPDIAELLDGYANLSEEEIFAFINNDKHRLNAGVKFALQELSRELRVQRDHQASVENARRYVGKSHLKLNLGCGREYRGGWVNIDLRSDTDLQLDVREQLPFEDGSVAIVYSEHFFEHLEFPREATRLLKESFRVLEPGGKFSVGVPDAEEILVQYAQGQLPALMQEWAKDDNLQWVDPWIWETPMHAVNFVFRQDNEHKYSYDAETLIRVLEQAGFVGVARRDFQPDLDSEHRQDGTLYVDAFKPV